MDQDITGKDNKKKGVINMSEKQKATHNAYCNYEVAKAKSPSRIMSVRTEVTRKPKGIKTTGVSRAMLARQLASLY